MSVPEGWTCDETFYGTDDGCECECGVRDPDCDVGTNYAVFNCPEDEKAYTCVGTECVVRNVPAGWTCGAEFYQSNDGCDCECGIRDPDCDIGTVTELYGCPDRGSFQCLGSECVSTTVPESWTCDAKHYDTSDDCHCGCGAHDPDCDRIAQDVLQCPDTSSDYLCKNGKCVDARVPSNWTCSEESYNTQDGCHCNCGTMDPDCYLPSAELFNCQADENFFLCVEGECVLEVSSNPVSDESGLDGKMIGIFIVGALALITILSLLVMYRSGFISKRPSK